MRGSIHVLVAILFWVLFAYHWRIVSLQDVGAGTLLAVRSLSILILAGLIASLWWVRHNLRIARKERRRGLPPESPAEVLHKDTLQRAIASPPLAALQQASAITIDIQDDRKIYRAEGEET